MIFNYVVIVFVIIFLSDESYGKKRINIDGVFYEYELVAGAHRFSAFEKMGVSEWIFDVYELGTQGVKSDLAMLTITIQ